nr:zinc ribbon domain-containing protein [Myxococcota bacterium]
PRDAGTPRGAGLDDTFEPVMIQEAEYASYLGQAIAPGGEIRIALPVLATSNDLDSLRLTRADFWIDHDDTAIRVTAEVHLKVSGSTRLAAPPGTSLLDLELPPGAEFLGLNGTTEMLGVEANGSGGLAVRGPLSPGASVVAYRYRLPVDGKAELDLRFERPVDLLNVLVADSGVVIESDRLHRKRPFKQGTRFYLHREAYQLDANESVVVGLGPLERPALSQAGARGAALFLAALAAFFLFGPLRGRREANKPASRSDWAVEREVLYESIRDLDHDFETGKIDEADYGVMRAELRSHAIELMREEKQGPPSEPLAARTIGRACPSCGAAAQVAWRFCAECGSDLDPGKEPA